MVGDPLGGGRAGSPEVGLDDLFGAPLGAPAGGAWRAPTPVGRWLIGRVFFSVALAALIFGGLYLMGYVAPYPLLVVTIFVVTLVKYALSGIAIRALPAQLTGRGLRPDDPTGDAGPNPGDRRPDGVDVAVGDWASHLHRGSRNASWYRGTVLPRLGELVDERLRLHHGVTRSSDPQRAREMMGEHLWRMLHDPSVGGTPRDMALMVAKIEEL